MELRYPDELTILVTLATVSAVLPVVTVSVINPPTHLKPRPWSVAWLRSAAVHGSSGFDPW
jgi:hypothetical protein